METVPYMERITNYYLAEGYDKPYTWAHYDDAPFTPLKKPLSECRVSLFSTGGIALVPEGGFSQEDLQALRGTNTGNYDVNIFDVPSDTPAERLLNIKESHDRHQTDMSDVDAFYPVTRLREFHAEGVLGSLATNYFRGQPNYSQRKVLEVDAPELLRRCKADNVDVMLLAPV